MESVFDLCACVFQLGGCELLLVLEICGLHEHHSDLVALLTRLVHVLVRDNTDCI